MRIKHLLYLLLALPLAFVACNDPEEPTAQPVITLTSEATMQFPAEGGEGVITYIGEIIGESNEVTGNFPVTEYAVEAYCDAEWVTDFAIGENIKFTVLANDGDARETEIDVKYGGKEAFKVVVKQAAKGEEPKPEYAMDVKLAAAQRYASSEFGLSDSHFALAFADDAENIELFLLLVGAEGETVLAAGDYSSNTDSLLAEECEMFIWNPAAEHTFTEGIASVAVDGDTYTFDIELADEDALLYHFTYEGTVLDMVPAEKPAPEAFVPVKVEAYRADSWDLGNFELDLYIDENNYHSLDMQDLVAPNDKYLTAGHYSMENGSVTSWSNFVYNIETGEGAYIVAAELDLTHNADGTSTLKGYFESEYGNHLDIDWTGVIAGFDFSTVEPTPGETVEFAASFFGGEYYEGFDNNHNYYFVLSDTVVDGSTPTEGATYYYFDIYADELTDPLRIPNGVYTYDTTDSGASGTFSSYYSYGFYVAGAETTVWYLYAEGSKVTVSDNKIVAELILEDGSKHTVTYEGDLSLAASSGGGDDSYSTLTGDLEVNLNGATIIAEYYDQYYNAYTDNYYVSIFEDFENGSGKYFVFDLLADYATAVDYSGTFSASDDLEPNTFLTGYLDSGYLTGSWYAEIEDGTVSGDMAPLVGGTINITINDDGSNTITLDCVDDLGYKITGTVNAMPYAGTLSVSKDTTKPYKSLKLQKGDIR